MRDHYTQQLDALNAELRSLGQLVTAALIWSVGAFHHQDREVAQRVLVDDHVIDAAQCTLEDHIVGVIATQQPVAGDLRRLLATMAIANELERIGDYAKSIAKITIRHADQIPITVPAGLIEMMDRALAMLNSALEAFIAQDSGAAQQLGVADDQIDDLQQAIRQELTARTKEEPDHVAQLIDLLALTHRIERIADRSTNIAEWVIFMVSGEQVELNP